tara:strand:- start:358 stop:909 length:552 start_codon:yes stop_codon:yes gene_type:complete
MVKELGEFHKNKLRKDGLQYWCKPCSLQAVKHSTLKKKNCPEFKLKKKWFSLRDRCNNPNSKRYYCYGGRGIKVEWSDFVEFKKDMFESYLDHVEKYGRKDTTIDRINNNGNYSKENCRWATIVEQQNNTSTNKILTILGESKTATQWANEVGLPSNAVRKRLSRGWSAEDALTKPLKKNQFG